MRSKGSSEFRVYIKSKIPPLVAPHRNLVQNAHSDKYRVVPSWVRLGTVDVLAQIPANGRRCYLQSEWEKKRWVGNI
jgi:hypothetical protein